MSIPKEFKNKKNLEVEIRMAVGEVVKENRQFKLAADGTYEMKPGGIQFHQKFKIKDLKKQ